MSDPITQTVLVHGQPRTLIARHIRHSVKGNVYWQAHEGRRYLARGDTAREALERAQARLLRGERPGDGTKFM